MLEGTLARELKTTSRNQVSSRIQDVLDAYAKAKKRNDVHIDTGSVYYIYVYVIYI